MSQPSFESQYNWALNNGVVIHDQLERKCVNGVYGMYAQSDIPANSLLTSIPKKILVKPDPQRYPAKTSLSVQQLHATSKELALGEHSKLAPSFHLFESIEDFKACSSYFCSAKEAEIIAELSPMLAREVAKQTSETNAICEALYQYDPSLSKTQYLETILNFKSRAIGRSGFVLIAESFNHSTVKGDFYGGDDTHVTLKTKVNYQAGDQVYISYGLLDLFTHAINYNYFDPDDQHCIQLSKRFSFQVRNAGDQALLQKLKQHFTINLSQHGPVLHYTINDPDALFTEQGPSAKLCDIAKHIAPNNPKQVLLHFLDTLAANNNSDQYSARYVPSRIKRFYHLLHKERQLIALNRQWLDQHL